MQRILAGETSQKVGEVVRVAGWVSVRRDHGKLIFIDLRDASGVLQLVFRPDDAESYARAERLRPEWVIAAEGTVRERPAGMENPAVASGRVELAIAQLEVLAEASTPPFPLETDGKNIEEELRLQYRYLDLRRPRLAANLRLRHRAIHFMRAYLTERGFVEIETPILTKATPEGARDFLVPSRLRPGAFYALPQSPQQYKQLLMVAGFEKYFQIARCFRDEDPRSDRAYGEFSQLDIEMSFASQDDILALTEDLLTRATEEVIGRRVAQKPFPRFTHREAMERFGSDKFDLRSESDRRDGALAFAWVTDFPLFEATATAEIAPSHHPFTAPKDEDIPLLDGDPMRVRSWQHDLVCNGLEVGGGSIRITDPALQKKIFSILGYADAEIEAKFGHLLRAFAYGVPPHGGIAPGIERLLMAWLGEENTREVMAFPMTAGGRTAVMNAPAEVESGQLAELGLKVWKQKSDGAKTSGSAPSS